MKYKIPILEITQPVGTFYVGKINSRDLMKITKTVRRDENGGIQRNLSAERAKSIGKYCEDPDAAFPTPIILAVKGEDVISVDKIDGIPDLYELVFEDNHHFAEILDGQHRVEGIKLAENFETDLMVVVMFDLTEEEKAYIFSTINSNQTKVDKSLIYDLFELSEERSPYKTCHEIARILNSDKKSPFYGRLKMLGKKGQGNTVLSQGTFVNYLCRLITNRPQEDMIHIKRGEKLDDNPRYVLRQYFIKERDDIILKLMLNYFGAVASVFPEEWEKSDRYILAKTTGYGALLKVFPDFYAKGVKERRLTREFFEEEWREVYEFLRKHEIQLISSEIPSGEQGQSYLADWFRRGIQSK